MTKEGHARLMTAIGCKPRKATNVEQAYRNRFKSTPMIDLLPKHQSVPSKCPYMDCTYKSKKIDPAEHDRYHRPNCVTPELAELLELLTDLTEDNFTTGDYVIYLIFDSKAVVDAKDRFLALLSQTDLYAGRTMKFIVRGSEHEIDRQIAFRLRTENSKDVQLGKMRAPAIIPIVTGLSLEAAELLEYCLIDLPFPRRINIQKGTLSLDPDDDAELIEKVRAWILQRVRDQVNELNNMLIIDRAAAAVQVDHFLTGLTQEQLDSAHEQGVKSIQSLLQFRLSELCSYQPLNSDSNVEHISKLRSRAVIGHHYHCHYCKAFFARFQALEGHCIGSVCEELRMMPEHDRPRTIPKIKHYEGRCSVCANKTNLDIRTLDYFVKQQPILIQTTGDSSNIYHVSKELGLKEYSGLKSSDHHCPYCYERFRSLDLVLSHLDECSDYQPEIPEKLPIFCKEKHCLLCLR